MIEDVYIKRLRCRVARRGRTHVFVACVLLRVAACCSVLLHVAVQCSTTHSCFCTIPLCAMTHSYICIKSICPHQKLQSDEFSTSKIPFMLICTTNSKISVILDLYHNECVGANIRWFPVDGFDTRCIPGSFSCGFKCPTGFKTLNSIL